MKAYKSRLTTDISYLSNFAAPSRAAAAGVLTKLSKVSRDLTDARNTLKGQRASTSSVAKGRTEVLQALSDSLAASADARSSASAARSDKRATAARDAKAEKHEIGLAIPLFESGGKALHLF